MAILKPEGRYLDSNYDHLKPEGLAGQCCLNSNHGHLKPEGLAGQCLEIFTFVVRYEKSATGNFFVLRHKKDCYLD